MFATRWVIKGRVQGVGFRKACLKQAVGLKGYVRNMDTEDAVEVVVVGEQMKIDQLKLWCGQGPILAKIEEIIEDKIDLNEELEEFEIRD